MTVIALCSLPCHQLEGPAPVASSPAPMAPASQGNTDATTAKTAWTVQMKETAVSFSSNLVPPPHQTPSPVFFLPISGSCGISINLFRLGGSLTDTMSHNMLLVIRGWLQIPRWISQAEVQPLCRYCADMLDSQQHTVGVIPQLAGRIPPRPECCLLMPLCVKSPSLFLPIHQASHSLKAVGGFGGREAVVTLICMHSRHPDDDLIFQITPSARSLGALMGPATTVHSDVTTFQTAGTAPMRQTAVRNQYFCKVINFKPI